MPNTTQKPMYFIGADPGVSGGVVVLNQYGRPISALKLKGADEQAIVDFLRPYSHGLATAVLERVWAQPKMGGTGGFTFGGSYYGLRMAFTALGIPWSLVLPKKWQTELLCLTGGDKNVTKARAQSMFGGLLPFTLTHANADALLIAVHCRREWKAAHGQEGKRRKEEKRGIVPRKGSKGRGVAEGTEPTVWHQVPGRA